MSGRIVVSCSGPEALSQATRLLKRLDWAALDKARQEGATYAETAAKATPIYEAVTKRRREAQTGAATAGQRTPIYDALDTEWQKRAAAAAGGAQ